MEFNWFICSNALTLYPFPDTSLSIHSTTNNMNCSKSLHGFTLCYNWQWRSLGRIKYCDVRKKEYCDDLSDEHINTSVSQIYTYSKSYVFVTPHSELRLCNIQRRGNGILRYNVFCLRKENYPKLWKGFELSNFTVQKVPECTHSLSPVRTLQLSHTQRRHLSSRKCSWYKNTVLSTQLHACIFVVATFFDRNGSHSG